MFVNEDNIGQITKAIVAKALRNMEKPKDEPRYKTIIQYERDFKIVYATGLSSVLKVAFDKYKKELVSDVINARQNTGNT